MGVEVQLVEELDSAIGDFYSKTNETISNEIENFITDK
jgi:hypothetical protein